MVGEYNRELPIYGDLLVVCMGGVHGWRASKRDEDSGRQSTNSVCSWLQCCRGLEAAPETWRVERSPHLYLPRKD